MTDATARRAPFDPVERETWEERVRRDVGDVASLETELLDGLRVSPLYTQADAPAEEPGSPPFRRGATAAAGWTLSHSLRGMSPEEIARSAADAEAGGAERTWLPLETLGRLDGEGELRAALGEHRLPIDAEIDPLGLAWTGAFARLAADVTPALDPHAHLARAGGLELPLNDALGWLAATTAATDPATRPALVDARVHHEAGAGASLELGAAIATGLDVLRALADRGHPLADAPRRMRFAFALGSDLFLGVAKLRAARLLWSKVLRALGVDGAEQGMRIHAFASRRERTVLAHHNDLLRGTTAAFAAALGGADRITLAPHEPTPHGERLARNTQLMLRDESHLDRVSDPAGGSYYVEALTDGLARAAWKTLQSIEGEGGIGAMLTSGAWQARVADDEERRQRALASAALPRVGVNRYPTADDPPPAAEQPAPLAPSVDPETRPPKALRDAIASGASLYSALRASDAPVSVVRAELARGREAVRVDAMPAKRDAAPFEAVRRIVSSLDDDARLAWVVVLGPPKALRDVIAAAREALGAGGLRVTVHHVDDASGLPKDPVPRIAIPIAADDEARATLAQALRDRGVARVEEAPAVGADRLSYVEDLLREGGAA